jgi:hypothetical protein
MRSSWTQFYRVLRFWRLEKSVSCVFSIPLDIPTPPASKKPSGEEIAVRAHDQYLERGGEHGKDVGDRARAEKELSDEPVVGSAKANAAQVVHLGTPREQIVSVSGMTLGTEG